VCTPDDRATGRIPPAASLASRYRCSTFLSESELAEATSRLAEEEGPVQQVRRGGHDYRVYGADQSTGQDVELIVSAYDEGDASRMANRQGVFVSRCVLVAAQSAPGTFGRAVSDDAVAQSLLARFPELSFRLTRLDPEDQAYLSDLARQHAGISGGDSEHMAALIRDSCRLPRR